MDIEYHELLDACSSIEFELTDNEIRIIEEDTRKQAKNRNFFRHRAGMIVASISYQASHTNPAQPSISITKTICYPDVFNFSNDANEHGCKHEDTAISAYEQVTMNKHVNFKINKYGTSSISNLPGYMQAQIFCVVAIAVARVVGRWNAFTVWKTTFEDYVKFKSSCLTEVNGGTSLKRDHPYYYQVQQQLFTTELKYCDFVVCSVKENIQIFHERIRPSIEHWNSVLPKLNRFWIYCVLPEVLGRWNTQKRHILKIKKMIPLDTRAYHT